MLNEFRPSGNVAGILAQLLVERSVFVDEIVFGETIDVITIADSNFVALPFQIVTAKWGGRSALGEGDCAQRTEVDAIPLWEK